MLDSRIYNVRRLHLHIHNTLTQRARTSVNSGHSRRRNKLRKLRLGQLTDAGLGSVERTFVTPGCLMDGTLRLKRTCVVIIEAELHPVHISAMPPHSISYHSISGPS
jgi:hypothetical protein